MKFKIMKSRFGIFFEILAVAFVIGLGVLWAMHHARAQAPVNADLTGAPTAAVTKATREDLYK